MWHSPQLKRRLADAGPAMFILVAGLVAFTAYGCVYAFRKPFTAAGFSGLEVWGVQYKIALVIAQVAGYALSEICRHPPDFGARPRAAGRHFAGPDWCGRILPAWFFALSPMPWGLFWMFLNGFPLGMAWGVVFGYLEGRRVTEALAALLCINFILVVRFCKNSRQVADARAGYFRILDAFYRRNVVFARSVALRMAAGTFTAAFCRRPGTAQPTAGHDCRGA